MRFTPTEQAESKLDKKRTSQISLIKKKNQIMKCVLSNSQGHGLCPRHHSGVCFQHNAQNEPFKTCLCSKHSSEFPMASKTSLPAVFPAYWAPGPSSPFDPQGLQKRAKREKHSEERGEGRHGRQKGDAPTLSAQGAGLGGAERGRSREDLG